MLLRKLENLKIGGKVLAWLESFLSRREQVVIVKNRYSDPQDVISGVPQGSVLGPILFLILMIDIESTIVRSALGSFADDTRLWHQIFQLLCVSELQEEINNTFGWSDINNMTFNDDKFEHFALGEGDRKGAYRTPSGKVIETNEVVMDLGVLFDIDLRFRQHIECSGKRISNVKMVHESFQKKRNEGDENPITVISSSSR